MKNDWRLRGLCVAQDTSELQEVENVFYLGRGGKANRAKLLCDDCPVKKECLAYALHYGFDEGIWGGLTPDERKAIPHMMVNILMLEVNDTLDTTEVDYTVWLDVWIKQTRSVSEDSVNVDIFDEAASISA